MAFELKIALSSIASTAESALIADESVWGVDELRADFGVFLKGLFHSEAEPIEVAVVGYDALTIAEWLAVTPIDGRYKFTAYAFPTEASIAAAEGVVSVSTSGALQIYTDGAWVETTLDDVLGSASYTSNVVDIPFLSNSYVYRNLLNLEYVKRVKADIEDGTPQDKLYYSRTELDYFYALVLSAEYNWALGLYSNFYQAVLNLTNMIQTGKIS